MSLQNLEQFKFTDEFKEKLVLMVVYHNHSPESLVKKYGLPNIYMLANWVSIYRRSLEKGTVTFPPMQSQKRKDAAVQKPIKLTTSSRSKLTTYIAGEDFQFSYVSG